MTDKDKAKNRGGRPPLPASRRRSEGIYVSATAEQRAWLEEQAVNRSVSGVVCELIDAAREGRAPLLLPRKDEKTS